MEAKDTVMGKKDITAAILADEGKHGFTHSPKYFTENIIELRATAKAQAEISFKAGQREVVEWMNEPCTHIETASETPIYRWGCPKCWQDFKKERGL